MIRTHVSRLVQNAGNISMDLTTLFVEAVIGYMKYMDFPQFSCEEFEIGAYHRAM